MEEFPQANESWHLVELELILGQSPPNIVLVILDAARWDAVSVYGQAPGLTPNLEALCERSIVFENAYANSCWSGPAYATIFTGLLPCQHGVYQLSDVLAVQSPTVAESLQQAGYETMGIHSNPFIDSSRGYGRGFDTYWYTHRLARGRRQLLSQLLSGPQLRAVGVARLFDKLNRFLRGRDHQGYLKNRLIQHWLKQRDSEKPFFLFVSYMEPHAPYQAPRPFTRMAIDCKQSADMDPDKVEFLCTAEGALAFMGGEVEATPQELAALKRHYLAGVAYADSLVGELLKMLKAQGEFDRSLIMVTADHGEALGENCFVGHRYHLYDTVLHVPLIVKYPGAQHGSCRFEGLVQQTDIFPTIMDIAGIKSGDLPGVRLNATNPGHPFVVAEQREDVAYTLRQRYPDRDFSRLEGWSRAIRTCTFKHIVNSNGKELLFRIEIDSGETENVAEKYPQVLGELRSRSREYFASLAQFSISESNATDDAIVNERLRALGYL